MISVYVTWEKPAHLLGSSILKPLQIGAPDNAPEQRLSEGTGETIAGRFATYGALTAQFWAWKNDTESSHIGLFRHDRLLDFDRTVTRTVSPLTGAVMEPSFGIDFVAEFGLGDAEIASAAGTADAVVPRPFDVTGAGYTSVRQHHAATAERPECLDLAIAAVRAHAPEDYTWLVQALDGALLYRDNIFIFTRPLFERYSAWLFALLEAIEGEIGDEPAEADPPPLFALGEILLTTFLLRFLAETQAAVLTLRPVHIADPGEPPAAPPFPDTDRAVISVVAASDRAYLPHLGALIASVLSNADPDRFVDFIVLDGGLDITSRRRLCDLEALHPHCRIAFVDMSRAFLEISTHSYFARSTFYRLAMPSLLANRNKVLFLDTDMVVLDDIAPLFDTPLAGKLIAAAPDLVMRSFAALGIRSIAETGGLPARTYLANVLRLGDRAEQYFQAGTVLFDLKAMRLAGIQREIIADLRANTYWFLDQDALNRHLSGKVAFIDGRWNAIFLSEPHYEALCEDDRDAYRRAFEDPGIVHFAGRQKPWENDLHPYSQYYWYYLRQTAWYEVSLFGLLAAPQRAAELQPNPLSEPQPEPEPPPPEEEPGLVGLAARKGWSLLPRALRRPLLPMARRVKRRLT